MSGGGGASGKYGTAALAGDLARRAQLSSVDSQAAATAASLPVTGANLSQNLLNTNLGTKATGTQTGTQTGGTSGTSSTTGGQSSTGVTNAEMGQSTNQAGGSVKI